MFVRQAGKPPNPRYITSIARKLRQSSTDAEGILWEALRNRQLLGIKFRRQVPYGRYVLDFFCKEKRLAVELDGKIHLRTKEYDAQRDEFLRAGGITVLRIRNDELFADRAGVLERIRQHL